MPPEQMMVSNGELHDAMFALQQIISRPRMIPQTGKYRLAKLHAALKPLYEPIEDRRQALVQKHGSEQFADEAKTQSAGWGIQPETPAFEAYVNEWNEIRKEAQLLPAAIEPIRLAALGDDPKGIEEEEFVLLGKFITEG